MIVGTVQCRCGRWNKVEVGQDWQCSNCQAGHGWIFISGLATSCPWHNPDRSAVDRLIEESKKP